MKVSHIEVLVEERSMGELLRIVLPKLVGTMSFEIHEYRSKMDLLARLLSRLKGYRAWIPDDHLIVVVVDRDDDDCKALKERMENIARDAGIPTKTRPASGRYAIINRIAVEELEAWYFGDWRAVRTAYPRVKSTVPSQEAYRDADGIRGGTWEAFERVLQSAGYFATGLRKIEAARAIAPHLRPEASTSPSFRAFRDAVAAASSDA